MKLTTPETASEPQEADVAKEGAYIYMRDKDGQVRYEHLSAAGVVKRVAQWQAGKFQELRLKRA